MSMAVDFSTPLTTKEREYLLARGRYADVERADNAHGTTGDPGLLAGDGTGLEPKSLLTSEAAARRKADLLAELRAIEELEGSADADDEEGIPYEKWKLSELQDEAKRRNLDPIGVKQVVVDRLYSDDEANAPKA
jgi:SAP domain